VTFAKMADSTQQIGTCASTFSARSRYAPSVSPTKVRSPKNCTFEGSSIDCPHHDDPYEDRERLENCSRTLQLLPRMETSRSGSYDLPGCGPGAIWTLDRPVSSGSRMSRSL